MDATKPYKIIGFGAMDANKPYKIIGLRAMDATKPYKFIGFERSSKTPRNTKIYILVSCSESK